MGKNLNQILVCVPSPTQKEQNKTEIKIRNILAYFKVFLIITSVQSSNSSSVFTIIINYYSCCWDKVVLYSPGWPCIYYVIMIVLNLPKSFCPCFLSAGIISMHNHIQLFALFPGNSSCLPKFKPKLPPLYHLKSKRLKFLPFIVLKAYVITLLSLEKLNKTQTQLIESLPSIQETLNWIPSIVMIDCDASHMLSHYSGSRDRWPEVVGYPWLHTEFEVNLDCIHSISKTIHTNTHTHSLSHSCTQKEREEKGWKKGKKKEEREREEEIQVSFG